MRYSVGWCVSAKVRTTRVYDNMRRDTSGYRPLFCGPDTGLPERAERFAGHRERGRRGRPVAVPGNAAANRPRGGNRPMAA